ncbi:MAG: hypothetical protein Q7U53_17320 [Anaerolineaceae bacterium]|nr:hypothetical protein [Anaerolineaceae bacterium]
MVKCWTAILRNEGWVSSTARGIRWGKWWRAWMDFHAGHHFPLMEWKRSTAFKSRDDAGGN